MSHRPTIDTLEAKRALEDAGLNPELAEILLRLVDTGIHNSTVDRAELEILRKEIIVGRVGEWKAIGVLVPILVATIALVQFGVSFAENFLSGFQVSGVDGCAVFGPDVMRKRLSLRAGLAVRRP